MKKQVAKMDSKTKAAADKAYEKYLKKKNAGTLPQLDPHIKSQAEKAYAKLKGKGIIEQKAIAQKVLKKAKTEAKAERKSFQKSFSKLGGNAAVAAKAFQKFQRGEHPKVKLTDAQKKKMEDSWNKFKAKPSE